jgi:hypothetical protein
VCKNVLEANRWLSPTCFALRTTLQQHMFNLRNLRPAPRLAKLRQRLLRRAAVSLQTSAAVIGAHVNRQSMMQQARRWRRSLTAGFCASQPPVLAMECVS